VFGIFRSHEIVLLVCHCFNHQHKKAKDENSTNIQITIEYVKPVNE